MIAYKISCRENNFSFYIKLYLLCINLNFGVTYSMTRSKRPCLGQYSPTCSKPEELTVLDLPTDLLADIFRMCPYEQVAESFRLVCRRFWLVATEVLNSGVAMLGPFIDRTLQSLDRKLKFVRTEGELLSLSRAYNAVEIIRTQFRLVQAVTWRYVAHTWTGCPARSCFYGGRLLDFFIRLLRMAKTDPMSLGWSFHFHHQDRSNTHRQQLQKMANMFMFHFEKFTEREMNTDVSVSGARIIDILDCLELENGRQVDMAKSYLDKRTGIYHYHAAYVMPRSWFTCLETDAHNTRSLTWSEEQRHMYLRLRRLVSNVNIHTLEISHYDREVLVHFQSPIHLIVSPPLGCTYNGYGHCEKRFFYYGHMNRSEYDSLFIQNNQTLNEILDVGENEAISSSYLLHRTPFDLKVFVDLICPMNVAPLAAYENFNLSDFDFDTNAKRFNSVFNLELTFECAASSVNRLPSVYKWNVFDHPYCSDLR